MHSSMAQQGSINEDAYIRSLEITVDGYSEAAICEAVNDCIKGNAPDVTNGFCPSPDKFGPYVRLLHQRKVAVEAAKERLKLPPPRGYSQTRISPFEKQRQKCLAEGRELLVADIALQAFNGECKANKYPTGSVWITTGEVYGPTKAAQEKAA